MADWGDDEAGVFFYLHISSMPHKQLATCLVIRWPEQREGTRPSSLQCHLEAKAGDCSACKCKILVTGSSFTGSYGNDPASDKIV